ncbi:hypothetical protein [Actinosynnema pretiosum]|uniref:Uncharacterized protein n=1 Tax=Actinosynnema pretiosum TaxID=42197 RepID=A0A290ZD54_9PSEU|nr:hypothetical protein [Actinosynnema pretiosum]ATE56970.1 hypothetical protein CNX65_29820 [Actinosynnema pretiosum]
MTFERALDGRTVDDLAADLAAVRRRVSRERARLVLASRALWRVSVCGLVLGAVGHLGAALHLLGSGDDAVVCALGVGVAALFAVAAWRLGRRG